MGVRGLKTFLERENLTNTININDEIEEWKRENPEETPTIVIDFMSLTHCVAKKENDTICGGRHQIALNSWKKLLDSLKATGCKLVFFSDLTLQESKIDTWLSRRNEKFDFYTSLYDLIKADVNVDTITATVQERKGLTTTFPAMETIAETYGEFNRSVKYECDLELAQYAKREKALAVISNDTDFMIFDGKWRLWMSNDLQILPSKGLKTVEFDREGLKNVCSLNEHQLALLATVIGNDFTKKYEDELYNFVRRLGPMRNKFQNVAQYIRGLSDTSAQSIAQKIFGSRDLSNLVKQSIASYSTDFVPATIVDPIEKKLLKTNMYRPYVGLMSEIQGITTPFYDLYHCKNGISFPMMLADWIKRKIGILRKNGKNNSFKFTLLMKKKIDEFYKAHIERPIYPDFEVPALDELYLGKNDEKMVEIKWKLFGWITSFSDEVISTMKNLPKKFLLISAILYALVKKNLMSVTEADGILYTEWKVYENDKMDVEYPKKLTAECVRAAHLYNIAFGHMRLNFSIAGLLPFIQELLQFDGVYYQTLMEKLSKMNPEEKKTFMEPIEDYRIYA